MSNIHPAAMRGAYRRRAPQPYGNAVVKKTMLNPATPLTEVQKDQVRKFVKRQDETKFFDANTTVAQQYGSGAGVITAQVSATAQGIAANQRIGDQIVPQRYEIKMQLFNQNTNPVSTTRVIIFQFRPNSVPTLASVLDNGPSGAPDINSPLNFDLRATYKVIWDKRFNMTGGVSSSNQALTISKNINLVKKGVAKVNFNAAATTGDHQIWAIILGSNAAGATGQLVTYSGRLYFKDA